MSKTFILGGAAALALALAGGAIAQTQATSQRQARAPQADISRTDFIARHVERLRAADTNNDGVVSADEGRAARQAAQAQRTAARFERLDADKDGVISRAEFEAGAQGSRSEGSRSQGPRSQGPGARGERGFGPRGGEHARRGPRADGGSRAEASVTLAEAEARAGQAFDRLDANSDGVLTADERRAGRPERSEGRGHKRGEGRPHHRGSPSAPASE